MFFVVIKHYFLTFFLVFFISDHRIPAVILLRDVRAFCSTVSKVQCCHSIRPSISTRCTSRSACTVTWRSTEPVQASRQRSLVRCSYMVDRTPTHTTSSLPDWPASFKTTTSVNCDSASKMSTPCKVFALLLQRGVTAGLLAAPQDEPPSCSD